MWSPICFEGLKLRLTHLGTRYQVLHPYGTISTIFDLCILGFSFSGLCPSYDIQLHATFRKMVLFRSSGKMKRLISITDPVSETVCF